MTLIRRAALALCLWTLAWVAQAQPMTQLAPGFQSRPASSALVVVQPDVELFSLSAGGVPEPRADWTEAAQQHLRTALGARKDVLGQRTSDLRERELDDLAEINNLHGAVAQAVFLHHAGGTNNRLPTKNGLLDWTLGEAVRPLKERTGADYALFLWVRDSYASAERKAAMVAMALLGVGLTGGFQVGYASLVDLRDGRLVWFNSIIRSKGDLREAESARESVDALLRGLPIVQ